VRGRCISSIAFTLEALKYDADADRESWDATVKMFREAFKP
jgi:hypothetical protein